MKLLFTAPKDPQPGDLLVVPHVATTHSQLCRYYGRIQNVQGDRLEYEVERPRMKSSIARTEYRCVYFTGVDYVWSRPNDMLHWVVKVPGFRDVEEPATTSARAISNAVNQYGRHLLGKDAEPNRCTKAAEEALEQTLHRQWRDIVLKATLDLKREPFILRKALRA